MNYEIVFSPKAQTDLDELEQYLAVRFSSRSAEKYIHRIMAFCRSLALVPFCGTAHDEIQSGLRTVGFQRRATIAFRVKPGVLEILGIFYGGQKIELEP